ncbi:MAG: hypothetical protein WDN72_07130 [Alphaproteobacteria bacterium]
MIKLKRTMQIPPTVSYNTTGMTKIVMAGWVALSPIANIVRADDPKWSMHANQHAKIHKNTLYPFGALEGAMNQAPMKNRPSGPHTL